MSSSTVTHTRPCFDGAVAHKVLIRMPQLPGWGRGQTQEWAPSPSPDPVLLASLTRPGASSSSSSSSRLEILMTPGDGAANEPVFYLRNVDPGAVRILFRACIAVAPASGSPAAASVPVPIGSRLYQVIIDMSFKKPIFLLWPFRRLRFAAASSP